MDGWPRYVYLCRVQRLQNTERVWWYIQREAEDTLGRPLDAEECVAAVVIVSALTKMLTDLELDEPVAVARPRTVDLDRRLSRSSR